MQVSMPMFILFFKDTVLKWGDFGKITLPKLLNTNPWVIIMLFILLSLLIFMFVEKYEEVR